MSLCHYKECPQQKTLLNGDFVLALLIQKRYSNFVNTANIQALFSVWLDKVMLFIKYIP